MGRHCQLADAGIELSRTTLNALVTGLTTIPAAMAAGQVKVSGNAAKIGELFGLLDANARMFEIVEPRRADVQGKVAT